MDIQEGPTGASVVPSPTEATAISAASTTRGQCICMELGDGASCECAAPMTREQVGRLRAYLSLHPEREVIYTDQAGEWMAALTEFLPSDERKEDRINAWLLDPHGLAPAADLQASADLGELLDLLDAPSAAALS
jgi:hypothetical protein